VSSQRDVNQGVPPAIGSLPPLHCLLAFEAAARNLSLSKAAGELRLTQSAVSQSIALLEDRLRVQLIRRLTPVVDLTEAGQRYFEAVQAFAHRLRDGLYERFPVGRTQLRVTAPQAFSRLWLAPRLGAFTRAHPRIDLILTSTERFEALLGGGVDIGLRYGGVSGDDRLRELPLWTDRLIVAGTPRLAAAAQGLSPTELARAFPLIEHPIASWKVWLAGWDEVSSTVRPLLVCSDLHLAIEAAVEGLGLVVAPARIVAARVASGRLCRISSHSVDAQPYRAVVSQEQFERAPVQAFLAWLLSEVALQASSKPPSISSGANGN
jgi:DNA-binding transcriptional LysR family regulator